MHVSIFSLAKGLVVIVLIVFFSASATAQSSLVFPHLSNVQQTLQVNPANPIDAKFALALGSAAVGYRNDVFRLGQLIGDRPLRVRLREIADQHDAPAPIRFRGRVDIFGATYNSSIGRFSVGVSQRAFLLNALPSALTRYAFFGDDYLSNRETAVENLDAEGAVFGQLSLGYQTPELSNGLRFGGSLKVLGGQAHAVVSDTRGETVPLSVRDTFPAQARGRVRAAGFAAFGKDTVLGPRAVLQNPSNRGLALDLGVHYTVDDNFSVGFSILDLGFIRWKERIYDGTFGGRFSSVGIVNLIDDTSDADDLFDQFDTLVVDSPFPDTEVPFDYGDSYTRGLKPIAQLTAQYQISDPLSIGATYAFDSGQSTNQQTIGLNGSLKAGPYAQILVGYVATGLQNHHLSVGTVLALGPLQIYASTDNLLHLFDTDKIAFATANVGANLILPMAWPGKSGHNKGIRGRKGKVNCYEF